jgi:membrane glycosyltransferase
MFVTGTMAYVSAPMWLAFLTLGTALWLTGSSVVDHWLAMPMELAGLWLWTLCLLFLPRVLGMMAVVIRGEQRQFGGVGGLLKSAALESALAIIQAPVRMLAHSLFVVVALTGIKLDWKSPPREAAAVPWRIAASQLAPMTLVIVALAVGVALIDASALAWLMPVGLPLLLAIPLTVLTSQIALGNSLRDKGFLLIPEESRSPAVLRRAWMHAVRLARPVTV